MTVAEVGYSFSGCIGMFDVIFKYGVISGPVVHSGGEMYDSLL